MLKVCLSDNFENLYQQLTRINIQTHNATGVIKSLDDKSPDPDSGCVGIRFGETLQVFKSLISLTDNVELERNKIKEIKAPIIISTLSDTFNCDF